MVDVNGSTAPASSVNDHGQQAEVEGRGRPWPPAAPG